MSFREIDDLNRQSKNIIFVYIIGWLLGFISFVGFWWSVVEFLIYLFKDNVFNWTPVWVLGSSIVAIIIYFIVVSVKALK